MNKFCGGDKDVDYQYVSEKVARFLKSIREDGPDSWITNKCYTDDKLRIERLSGKRLSMDSCYINLAIREQPRAPVDDNSETESTQEKSQNSVPSLQERLKIDVVDKTALTNLATLFSRSHGSRRILIHGRAGVGKTTLCRKIVHDFTKRAMWADVFRRVLWVPLQILKRLESSKYNLETLLRYTFFERCSEANGKRFARDLDAIVKKSSTDVKANGRTLFIFDGLDEIPELLTRNHAASEFIINDLLNLPDVIMTSRPHGTNLPDLEKPDLELDTIGFLPDQVAEYIEANVSDEKTKKDIRETLEKRPLLQSLVRIPVQLDALCFVWTSLGQEAKFDTMTALYRAIERVLWKKDIVRLEKKDGDALITPEKLMIERRAGLKKHLVSDEMSILEELAFAGLQRSVVQFDDAFRISISEKFMLAGKSDTILLRLSFLRKSSPSQDDEHQSFHFLHLTYQEYFAAQYFVRQWMKTSSRELEIKNEDSGCSETITPEEFLRRYKYTDRYDILWRFVAGLLDAQKKAVGFFNAIQEEPRDLLGPTHQRLVMRCMSECVSDNWVNAPLRIELETELRQFVEFLSRRRYKGTLVREVEFPQSVLHRILTRPDPHGRIGPIIRAQISVRRYVHPSTLQVVVEQMKSWRGDQLAQARDFLSSPLDMPKAVIEVLCRYLEDSSQRVTLAALRALIRQRDLPEDSTMRRLRELLNTPNDSEVGKDIQKATVELFATQSSLSDVSIEALVGVLSQRELGIQLSALEALGNQSQLPERTLKAIVAMFKDYKHDPMIVAAAAEALVGQDNLHEKHLTDIAKLLAHEDASVREAAIEALTMWSPRSGNLPPVILSAIEGLLGGTLDWAIQEAAARAMLNSWSHLSSETRGKVKEHLHHKDLQLPGFDRPTFAPEHSPLTRRTLTAIAAGQSPEGISSHWRTSHDHNNFPERQYRFQAIRSREPIKRRAAGILIMESGVQPEANLAAIVPFLKDGRPGVRKAAVRALSGQVHIPEAIRTVMEPLKKHRDWRVRNAAEMACSCNLFNIPLPDATLRDLAAQLENKDQRIANTALYILRSHPKLGEAVLASIAERLQGSQDWTVRTAAAKVLYGRSELPEAIIKALVTQLCNDELEKGKILAARVLGSCSRLYQDTHTLKGIIAQLMTANNNGVIDALKKCLAGFSNLPPEILYELLQLAEMGSSPEVSRAATDILGHQSGLSADQMLKLAEQAARKVDSEVGNAFWMALSRQRTMSKDVISVLATSIEENSRQPKLSPTLVRHAHDLAIGAMFLNFDSSIVCPSLLPLFYEGLLEKSCWESWSLCFDNDELLLTMPSGIQHRMPRNGICFKKGLTANILENHPYKRRINEWIDAGRRPEPDRAPGHELHTQKPLELVTALPRPRSVLDNLCFFCFGQRKGQ